MNLYEFVGAPNPIASLVIVTIFGAAIFGGGWWVIGKQYAKEHPPKIEAPKDKPADKKPTALIEESKKLRADLWEIKRCWPDSLVWKQPLYRFLWSAPIGETNIGEDVRKGIQWSDSLNDHLARLEKSFGQDSSLPLITINKNQLARQMIHFERCLELLEGQEDSLREKLTA